MNIEDKMQAAIHTIEVLFPPKSIGLLLLGAVPTKEGFHLYQIGNCSTETVREMLVAAISDIDAGLAEFKERPQ